ncbi:septum formation family protein [Microbacterium karelineae]|uniref:septum formation family protein n=1 Tax=Microbacterium karelineae TaxID=2654283 RepID=UPI0012E9A243|nr:septum formation family protein [Microbacterium karelineae]
MFSQHRAARFAAVGGALLLAASLAGCGSISSLLGGAERDAETDEVTESGTESVFDIKVGDCLLEPDATGDEIYDIEIVPCADPHDYEFYYEYSLDLGEEWPGDAAIEEDAGPRCDAEFEKFVGVPFQESEALWYSYYSPSAESWADGDDVIQCIVFEASDPNGMEVVQVEGSLEGAAR